MLPLPPRSTLFPYTTLFRSRHRRYRAPLSRGNGSRRFLSHSGSGDQRQRRRGDRRNLNVKETRSEEHTSELQSLRHLVCRLLLEKKKNGFQHTYRTCKLETA